MKFRSTFYGIGRFGDIVGRTGKNGEYIISRYQRNVNQPNTQAQLEWRKKAKVAFQGLAPFAQVAFLTLRRVANSNGRTYWQELIKKNYAEAVAGTYPNYEINLSKLVISDGPVDLPYSPSATCDGTTLTVTWADNSGMGNAAADDRIGIVAYNDAKRQLVFQDSVGERADRNASMTLPTAWTGDNVDIWIYLHNNKLEFSPSTHLASIPL